MFSTRKNGHSQDKAHPSHQTDQTHHAGRGSDDNGAVFAAEDRGEPNGGQDVDVRLLAVVYLQVTFFARQNSDSMIHHTFWKTTNDITHSSA